MNYYVLWNFYKTLDSAASDILEMTVSIGEVTSVPGIERTWLQVSGFKLETNLRTDFRPPENGDL